MGTFLVVFFNCFQWRYPLFSLFGCKLSKRGKICLNEEVIDNDGNFCYLYITDNYTDLDILQTFTQSCVESVEHNGRKLLYGIESQTSYIIAEDGGYKYYIKVEENLDRDFIFSLVDKLWGNK